MKIEITTTSAITGEELKEFMKFFDCAEDKYPNLEIELKAEILRHSVKNVLKTSADQPEKELWNPHNLTPEQRKEVADWLEAERKG
jgi:hypothetical protein